MEQTTKKRVLVVDNEQDLCEILLFNLMAGGYEAEAAYSAEEAWRKMAESKAAKGTFPDLLLLDVMMPGMSGFEFAALLRQDEHTARIPIIFLTACTGEDDTLQGFGLGADDYVTKPFSVREVMARVKAVLSRTGSGRNDSEEALTYKGLWLNQKQKTFFIEGEETSLTRTEYELLSLLLSHQGQVLSRQELLEKAWPKGVVVTGRTVDVHIARLRKKMGMYASCIVSRQGFGYCFEDSLPL